MCIGPWWLFYLICRRPLPAIRFRRREIVYMNGFILKKTGAGVVPSLPGSLCSSGSTGVEVCTEVGREGAIVSSQVVVDAAFNGDRLFGPTTHH